MRDLAIHMLVGAIGGMTAVVFANFCIAAYKYIKNGLDIWPDGFS